jgi:hypothetical protein
LRLQICLQNMRMSCNSTYLLDHKTDYGVKADELAELLSEMLEEQQCKVVVFSQWLRMHELVARRLQSRGWQHVMFHGGVPGPQRKDLIRRFKEDPQCRLFLSTDAGGVGLNLQNAAAVVNLDQPWNPAVLEQRVGRVHRLGQHRPVRVVHFIAQGTIEEGMLSLLAFKSAMFSGVLDNGQDEVFMGGTRLKRFMESVEKVTGSIPQPMPQQPERGEVSEAGEMAEVAEAVEAAQPPAPPQERLWADVVTAGMSLLERLGQALVASKTGAQRTAGLGLPAGMVTRDQQTGQPYLKLPLPEPETMQKIVELFAAFAKGK